MTDQSKPCFPGCRSLQYNHGANYLHIPGCPNDKPAPCRFCGYRHEPPRVHAENPPRTIINVSVTPASDEDVSEWKQWGGEFTRLCARIEQEKAANAELRANKSAFVEMNAVFEAVMRAIRGEALSEFDLSHGAVCEAQMLREANNAHARITATLRARLAEVSERADKYEAESEQKGADLMACESQLEEYKADNERLYARLGEVSQAAMAVVSNSDMATPPTIAAMAALEAILAKGE